MKDKKIISERAFNIPDTINKCKSQKHYFISKIRQNNPKTQSYDSAFDYLNQIMQTSKCSTSLHV